MTVVEIADSLRQVFSTLQQIQKAEAGGAVLAPSAEASAESPRKKKLRSLRKIPSRTTRSFALSARRNETTYPEASGFTGMDQKEYKKKYGFPMKTPLAAKALTKARSKAAKKRGLPENLVKYLAERKQSKAEAETPAKPTGAATERAKKVRGRFTPKAASKHFREGRYCESVSAFFFEKVGSSY